MRSSFRTRQAPGPIRAVVIPCAVRHQMLRPWPLPECRTLFARNMILRFVYRDTDHPTVLSLKDHNVEIVDVAVSVAFARDAPLALPPAFTALGNAFLPLLGVMSRETFLYGL